MSIVLKRNLVLWTVNILIGVHILLWHYFHKWGLGTISPQGGLDVFVDGVITGSAIFTVVLVVLTVACGRLACGWLCHFAAFQETSAAALKKLKVDVRPRHSRASVLRYLFLVLLLVVPVHSLLTKGLPRFNELSLNRVEVFTPDLPRGWVFVATILVSALLITGLFGSRPFCRYLCPWSLILRFFDRVSPTRIRQRRDCQACRTCSDNCPMGIDVQAEIATSGRVRSTECIRCLTCTNGCPNEALVYSGRRTGYERTGTLPLPGSNFTWVVDGLLIGLGVVLAFVFNYKLDNFQGWLGAAWGISLGLCLVRTVTARSWRDRLPSLVVGLALLATVVWIVLFPTQSQLYKAGETLLARRQPVRAEQVLRQAIALSPHSSRSFNARNDLARALEAQGKWDEALAVYQEMLGQKPYYAAETEHKIGLLYTKRADFQSAVEHYRRAVAKRPRWAVARWNLGIALRNTGDEVGATQEMTAALRLDPSLASAVSTPHN